MHKSNYKQNKLAAGVFDQNFPAFFIYWQQIDSYAIYNANDFNFSGQKKQSWYLVKGHYESLLFTLAYWVILITKSNVDSPTGS